MLIKKIKIKNYGYTLIEIIIVLIIVGIIASFAVPSFVKIMKLQNLQSVANDIADLFNYSKAQALTRNKNIFICTAFIKKDGKLNNCINLKDDDNTINSFLAFTQDDNENKLGKYTKANDIKYIHINKHKNMKFKFHTFQIAQINNPLELTNPEFIQLSNNKLATKQDYNDDIISYIGNMAKITIQDKFNNKLCKVIKIESSGKARVCNNKDLKDIKSLNFLICSCDNNKKT